MDFDFTISLPPELKMAGLIFALMQTLVLLSLGWTSRLNERIRLEAEVSLGRLAAQVAHNIRSPLAALRVAFRSLEDASNDAHELVGAAATRIQGIADDLLKVHRSSLHQPQKPEIGGTPIGILCAGIQSLSRETAAQYGNRPDLAFDCIIESQLPSDTLVRVHLEQLKRILSNLVNNSVESIAQSGKITIKVTTNAEKVFISVSDTGKGMDPTVVNKLGNRGFTIGKTGGSGIGLHHARVTLKSWRGNLAIQSAPGSGTQVGLTLLLLSAANEQV